jgi:hypothetical protein
MQTILFNILLLLTVIWLLVGILFLWQQLHTVRQKVEEESKKKNKQKQKQSTSSVTQDQVEQARQILVGKSKSYRERYDEISKEITTNSQKIPDVPDTSSKEKSADNPNTFAGKNSSVSGETKEAEGTEDDNEMQVDYTMDEPDEDTIIREELQIAYDSLPEVSPSAILTRDLSRINTVGTGMTMHSMRKAKPKCRIRCKAYGAHSSWTISKRQRLSRRKTIKSYLLPFARRKKRNWRKII